MATLIGPAPPDLTFQDLVGETRSARHANRSPPPYPSSAAAQACASRNRLMRIYLPEGVVRVMALTRHQEFLLSYSIQDNDQAAQAADRDADGGASNDSR